MTFLKENYVDLFIKCGEHLYISAASLILGILVAIPLGILLTRKPKAAGVVMGIASVFQTIPSFALLALMTVIGVGKKPAIVALFIYSLLPILRNTYLGIRQVPEDLIDAGKGMGMTDRQVLFDVQLPMAMPVLMNGIRLAAVYVISWATLASYIGAGGLGDYIFTGLQNYIPEMIIMGTIPVTIMALLADFLLGRLSERLSSEKISGGAV